MNDNVEQRFDIANYDGPLDLLSSLLSKQAVSVFDIPITEIANQYLAVIRQATELNMELTSEFLLMAATLLQIKTHLMLRPDDARQLVSGDDDPLDDLVMRLLAYRRCKLVATMLAEGYAQYGNTQIRGCLMAKYIGITDRAIADDFSMEKFDAAVTQVTMRNQERFQAVAEKMALLVTRERISMKTKMQQVWLAIKGGTMVFFHELFPQHKASKREQITGFIAILEMVRQRCVKVSQSTPFAALRIERGSEAFEQSVEESEVKM